MLPSFETDRLLIRPRTDDDFEACLAMDRDPEVTKFVVGPWGDAALHEKFLRERIDADFGEGLGYWSIFPEQEPNAFLGWILLIPCDGFGPEIEIGWRLNRASWGYGYAPEAARPILHHAFTTVGLERVTADIDSRNERSHRVAEKIGMQFIGDAMHLGRPCRSYALTRRDFQAGETA
ncbi:N-acetyltransferase [Hwanghaeella grinnelliae]|uniref:N-acetyltransferase n=1 Tax=Hwanghaeella grinnelliae TaxID=2500179 RepID=A0A3S2WCK9_9PROT|nr:GNAT family N-acetyltransferase [Hwanghaeella grinnelliae]RVU39341.1 N-acetyltransferase [Hwanghaeella grinnelliae]